MLKRSNDLKTISNWLICFQPASEIWSRSSKIKIVPELVRVRLKEERIFAAVDKYMDLETE